MSAANPFATRCIRPGAIEYLFDEGQSAESLVEALAASGWWGQIVGPHGSGKSTLLAALAPVLAAAGRRAVWRVARGSGAGDREWGVSGPVPRAVAPSEAHGAVAAQAPDAATQVIIDGYEQLSWWSRRQVAWLCRRCGAGLLVTAHRPLGLPTLLTTLPREQLAQRVVQRLLPAGDTTVSQADVAAAFAASGGNLRETLFALYDVYQLRRQSS
jgi:hypothetical protein